MSRIAVVWLWHMSCQAAESPEGDAISIAVQVHAKWTEVRYAKLPPLVGASYVGAGILDTAEGTSYRGGSPANRFSQENSPSNAPVHVDDGQDEACVSDDHRSRSEVNKR
jgi:hypothetical protein